MPRYKHIKEFGVETVYMSLDGEYWWPVRQWDEIALAYQLTKEVRDDVSEAISEIGPESVVLSDELAPC